jgi:hypothetical protein
MRMASWNRQEIENINNRGITESYFINTNPEEAIPYTKMWVQSGWNYLDTSV